MKIAIAKPLFAWDELDDSPTLKSLRSLLEAVPDLALLDALRESRGKGRDHYPVEALWGTLLLSIALRHLSVDACLEELRRNAALRILIGIESEERVPGADNMSRFLATLGEEPHLTHLRKIFDVQVSRLGRVVADLDKDAAGDSTGLAGRPALSDKLRAAEIEQGLPQPAGGKKEYADNDGKVTHIVEWFGYKLHLLVDVEHEVALAYHITDTKTGDNEKISGLVEQAKCNLPQGRVKTLAYDKAADDGAVHEFLTTKAAPRSFKTAPSNSKSPRRSSADASPSTSFTIRPAPSSATTRSAIRPSSTRWPTSVTNRTAAPSSIAAPHAITASIAPATRPATANGPMV